jgi:ATP adenylyltransferase
MPPAPPTDPALGHATLQAPWRLAYLETLPADAPPTGSTPTHTPATSARPRGTESSSCFLREYWLDPAGDQAHHVIVRSPQGLILLNAYPYANGHLLVALGEGRPRLMDYDPAQRAALWALVDAASALVDAALQPQGINIGINQGRAAGAGVPGHLHVHLVPRWGGDVNFMTVVARTRVIPSSLEAMAQRYRRAWAQIAPAWDLR